MQCDNEDDAYLAPVNDSPGFGWMKFYSRLAGCIQMLFAVFLGWLALSALPGLAYDIAHNGESIGKGLYVSINPRDVFVVTVFSLLSFSGFTGGCGLLGLRPWARRWEIAYLGIISVAVAGILVAMISGAIRRPYDFDTLTMMVQVAMVFALPYLPFLLTRRPGVASTPPCKLPSKPIVNDLYDE